MSNTKWSRFFFFLYFCGTQTVPTPLDQVECKGNEGGFDSQIEALGLELPPPPKPIGSYKPAVISGGHIYTSGHGPKKMDGHYVVGRVGEDCTVEQGKEAGRLTGLLMLATLRNQLGSLDRVKKIVKTLGMVNTNPDTIKQLEHVEVVNGFSELMKEVFGEDCGVGARSAVGMASLPNNIPVEVEAIFEIHS